MKANGRTNVCMHQCNDQIMFIYYLCAGSSGMDRGVVCVYAKKVNVFYCCIVTRVLCSNEEEFKIFKNTEMRELFLGKNKEMN